MFDNLVVSTAQRRRGRTAKFFAGTSAIYLSAVAVAFALSVVLATPKLAYSELKPICILIPPPAPHRPRAAADHPNSGSAARQDLSNLRRLEDIVDHPQTGASRITAPGPTAIGQGDGLITGDPNAPPGNVGVIGGDLRTIEAPPRPPDPPKPPARTATDDGRPMRVTSVVLQGKAIERVVPFYPELPKRIRMQGEVSLEVIISPEGRVESVRIVSGHPMFVNAALEAARRWRFEPTLLNGVPVRVTGVITFVFKLNE